MNFREYLLFHVSLYAYRTLVWLLCRLFWFCMLVVTVIIVTVLWWYALTYT